MSQSEDPVDTIVKRLNQIHQAQVEMKDRQATAEDSKRMEQALKGNIEAIEHLDISFRNMSNSVNVSVMQATGSLSRSERLNQKEVDDLQTNYRRKTWRVALFFAIVGVLLGIMGGVAIIDYHNARTFLGGLQSMFGEQVCKQAGGTIVAEGATSEMICVLVMK
jgi:hypothetical protein